MANTTDKVQMLSKPVHNSVLRVYLAGKMEWLDSEDSTWTCVLSPELRAALKRLLPPNVEVVYPDDTGFDHGGDLVAGIVAADLALLKSCDACVAVFSTPNQVGTLIEALEAIQNGLETLLIFTAENVKELNHVEMRGESDHYWFLINYVKGDKGSPANVRHWGFVNATCVQCPPRFVPIMIADWISQLKIKAGSMYV